MCAVKEREEKEQGREELLLTRGRREATPTSL